MMLWYVLLVLIIISMIVITTDAPVTGRFQSVARDTYFSYALKQAGGDIMSSGSKCFSCEQQDAAMGIRARKYGSKCIDCEVQDANLGLEPRSYGVKIY